MKTLVLASLSVAALVLTGGPSAFAQDPVSTGIVQGVATKTGALTIRSNETSRPITFYGMEKASIARESGTPAALADVQPGMQVTVRYAVRGDRWYINKVLLPDATSAPALATIPAGSDPALRSPAARDGDITTQPGSKAMIDRDITTQPGSKAAIDRDITTQPTGTAAVDGDITTKPTGNAAAATDGDITTRPASQGGTPLRRTAP